MTWDFNDSNSRETNLIENINKIFELNISVLADLKPIADTNLFLINTENDFCQIAKNSIEIKAHINTATSLSLGFLNLTGKNIAKALGGLSGVLLQKTEEIAPTGKSVVGGKISQILQSLITQEYV